MGKQNKSQENNKMTRKDYNLSFISGILGFILLIAPIGLIAINAEDGDSVHSSVYDGDSARDDTYENDHDDFVDIPEHEDNADQPNEIEDLEPGIVEVVENSVTNDVYYYYELNEDNIDYYSADEGDMFIPDAKSITLPTNLIHSLSDENHIEFNQKDMYVRIPVSSIKNNLPEDTTMTIFLIMLPNWNGGSGPQFELVVLYGDDDLYNLNISGPIFIQFKIDTMNVENWEDIVLYDIYEERYLEYQAISVDKQTGKAEVQIDYLSSYGILSQDDLDPNDNSHEDENETPIDNEHNDNPPSVTDDVYYTITKMDELKKHKNSDGNFVINDKVEVDIFPSVIKEMPDDKFFIINQDEIQLAIPVNAIKDIANDEIVTIEVREDPWNQDGVSKVYNIYILLNFNEYKGPFTEPIRATFHVDSKKVKNWSDLVLGTYDAEWNLITYKNQVIQIDPTSATVETALYHLSPYGIFEIEGSGDDFEKVDTEKPSTTDDVYHTIVDEEDLTGHYDKQGNIHFKDAKDVVINGDVLSGLANNKSIILTQKDAELSIPVDALKGIAGEKQVRFEVKDVSHQFQDSLGTVIDFTLFIDGEKYEGKWKDAFQLTFKIDPKKVNNWDNLVLRFIDEKGNVTDDKNQIVSVDKETGEVIAEVNQSGKYGIYEVEDNGVKGNTSNENSGLGSILPNTSTNTYNFLAIGSILLLVGFILLINRTKQPK